MRLTARPWPDAFIPFAWELITACLIRNVSKNISPQLTPQLPQPSRESAAGALNAAPVSIATATASASRRGAYLGRPTATTCLPDAPGPGSASCVRARAALTLLCALAADASSFCSTPDPSLQRAPAPWYSSWHAAYHSVAHSCRHLPRVPQRRSTFRALLWRSRATWQRARAKATSSCR